MFPNNWYIFLYISLLILLFISKVYRSQFFLYIFVGILVCFSGFRYNAGIDYDAYQSLIYSNNPLLRIEPFSAFLLLLARSYNAPWIFFFLTSIIYVLSIFLGLSKFKAFGRLSVFLFTTFTLSYLSSFGFVRQFVASGLVFWGFSFLYHHKRLYYIILVIIASLFHISAIVFLPFAFVNIFFRKKIHFSVFLLLIPISFLSTKLFIAIVSKIGLFTHYFEQFGGNEVSGKKIYYSLLFIFVIVSFLQQKVAHKKNDLIYYSQNLTFIGLFIYGAFFSFGEHIARISYYFIPFYFVWFYYLYRGFFNKTIKILFLYFIFSICTFYFFSTLYYAQFSSKGDFLNNYEIIFNQ